MRWFALIVPIVLAAAVCGGSNAQDPQSTGTIAFTRGASRAGAVWMMKADGSGQRMLARGGAPVWSRDGGQILYGVLGRNYGIHLAVINANGGTPRRLTRPEADYEQDLDPVWSPDGRRIAFTRYDSDPNYAIHIVAVRGGPERKLTPWFWPRGAFAGPTWALGGRKIAFNHVHRGIVYVIRPDGMGLSVLARIAGAERVWGVRWSPDGRLIAFISDDYLWVMNADGTQPRKIVDNRVDNRGLRRADFAWSPDSRKIAFTQCCREVEVYVVNADGSELLQLTDNDNGVFDGQPDWSPDGRSIAFTSDRDGNTEIYVMNADGSDQRNVSQSSLADYTPAWSPKR